MQSRTSSIAILLTSLTIMYFFILLTEHQYQIHSYLEIFSFIIPIIIALLIAISARFALWLFIFAQILSIAAAAEISTCAPEDSIKNIFICTIQSYQFFITKPAVYGYFHIKVYLIYGIILLIALTARFYTTLLYDETKVYWWNGNSTTPERPFPREKLIEFLCSDEPLNKNKFVYFSNIIRRPKVIVILLTIPLSGIGFGLLTEFVNNPHIPFLFNPKTQIGEFAAINSNLTALLALIAAAVSIIFTFQQLRSKVRSESRQAWINNLKTEISITISIIQCIKTPQETNRCTGPNRDLTDNTNYELMRHINRIAVELNPSEIDHRLLLFLIRSYINPSKRSEDDVDFIKYFNPLSNACFFKKILHEYIDTCRNRKDSDKQKRRVLLEKLIKLHASVSLVEEDKKIMIYFIQKLSGAILKREWERVRNIR